MKRGHFVSSIIESRYTVSTIEDYVKDRSKWKLQGPGCRPQIVGREGDEKEGFSELHSMEMESETSEYLLYTILVKARNHFRGCIIV